MKFEVIQGGRAVGNAPPRRAHHPIDLTRRVRTMDAIIALRECARVRADIKGLEGDGATATARAIRAFILKPLQRELVEYRMLCRAGGSLGLR